MKLEINEAERVKLQIALYARIAECDEKLDKPNPGFVHDAVFADYWRRERAEAYALLNRLGGLN